MFAHFVGESSYNFEEDVDTDGIDDFRLGLQTVD